MVLGCLVNLVVVEEFQRFEGDVNREYNCFIKFIYGGEIIEASYDNEGYI